jgi:hypothetical protein
MYGYVYLIGELDNKDVYKIGVTRKTVEERLKELQTGSSNELYIRSYFQSTSPYKLEKMLHRKFAKNNKINEWFTLTESEAKDFINTCQENEEIIVALKENPFF